MNKLSIGDAQFSDGIVESRNPEATIYAFFGTSISVCVHTGLNYRFLGGGVVGLSFPLKSFCLFDNVFAPFGSGDSSFDSTHMTEV
jgi:hypothetical protein